LFFSFLLFFFFFFFAPSFLFAHFTQFIGMCLVISGHPLDTLKVRLQTAEPGVYKGTVDCAMRTIKKEGPFALYRGMLGPLIGVTPMFALCFFGYGVGKTQFTTDETFQEMNFKNVGLIGLAGATSGLFSTPMMAPLERVKCIMQIQGSDGFKLAPGERKYTGITECLKDTYHRGGVTNLFRGFWSTMGRDCTASFFYFSTYEFLKFHLNPRDGSSPSVLATLFAGGFAGIMNWAGCLPIDTLKSRYQVAPKGKYPNGIRSVFAEVMRNEGPMALYRGAAPIMIRAFPANAACFLGMEATLRFFKAIDY
jgi:solute carrier family 25 carnitine/acylcarnitine transporter 20/29